MDSPAIHLIKENILSRNPVLDLGNCELRELPDELFECVWIEELILSSNYWDYDAAAWKKSVNIKSPNHLSRISGKIANLQRLRILRAGGDMPRWHIRDIDFAGQLLQLTALDLNDNHIEDIAAIKWLSNLRSLNLGKNNIFNIGPIEHLGKLEYLNLRDNAFYNLKPLRGAVSLRHLDMGRNNISGFRHLKKLDSLEFLGLDYTQVSDISFLKGFSKLKNLNLSNNNVSNLLPLQNLSNLASLYLNFNHIQTTHGMQNLASLKTLHLNCVGYMGNGKLADITALAGLTRLEYLSIQENKLSDISALKELKELKHLDASKNDISDIGALQRLTRIEYLDLSGNHLKMLTSIYPLLHLDRKAKVKFDVWRNWELPDDVVKAGWAAIRDRLLAIQQKEQFISVREVKVLLLGNTNVGKSNLLEFFKTGQEPQLTHSTHGIQYETLPNVIKGININCWDFGGQEYFHATHRLFFSPGALNIILWSKENIVREQGEECFDLNYWLRCVDQLLDIFFGVQGNAKNEVILCENKIDLQHYREENMDQSIFKIQFPKLNLTFTHFNLKPLRRMEGFRELISEKVQGLFIDLQFSYHEYLLKIRASASPFLLIADFVAEDQEAVKTAMQVFHNMGIVLYFPNIMPEKVFIKPQMLLDLLYEKILSSERNYVIDTEFIESVIANNKLNLQTADVVRLMKTFDLVFQIPSKINSYFIPQYLRPLSDSMAFLIEQLFDAADIRIESDLYLMNVAMLKVFSYYGKFVKEEKKDEYVFWKDGIVIYKDGVQLMIRFDKKHQAILLFPSRVKDNAGLQSELVRFILNIGKEIENVFVEDEAGKTKGPEFTEKELDWSSQIFKVYVSADGFYFAHWPVLLKMARSEVNKLELTLKNNTDASIVAATKIGFTADFGRFFPKSIQLKIKKRVFISYSHKDILARQRLEKHLRNLVADNLIDLWHDDILQAGDNWDDKIKEAINTADISIILVSQDLINSAYVHETELRMILERRIKLQCRIIFVLVKDCDWKNWRIIPKDIHDSIIENDLKEYVISSFQFLPVDDERRVKPLTSWKPADKAWLQVTAAVRKFCEKG